MRFKSNDVTECLGQCLACGCLALASTGAWRGSSALACGWARPDDRAVTGKQLLARPEIPDGVPGKLRAESVGRTGVGLWLPKGSALRAPLTQARRVPAVAHVSATGKLR